MTANDVMKAKLNSTINGSTLLNDIRETEGRRENKIMLTAGPSNADPAVCDVGQLPLTGHLSADFLKMMDDVKQGLQYAFQTTYEWTLAVSGTGHAAMECCLFNLVEAGETVLVLNNGVWGTRVAALLNRINVNVQEIKKPYGDNFSYDEIEAAMKSVKPVLVFACHSESSGGAVQPVDRLGELCRNQSKEQGYDCLCLVDTVASLGGVPIHAEEWGIDAIYSGAQKCLSCPPGASPLSIGPRAVKKIQNRKTPCVSFYFDMVQLANYWGCDGQPRRYHHTGAIVSVYQLREGLRIVAKKGLDEMWKTHLNCSKLLWSELAKNGFEMYVKEEEKRLITVNVVCVPDGVDAGAVLKRLREVDDIELSGGLGALAGKVWRIGLMGFNCTEENVHKVVKALTEACKVCRK